MFPALVFLLKFTWQLLSYYDQGLVFSFPFLFFPLISWGMWGGGTDHLQEVRTLSLIFEESCWHVLVASRSQCLNMTTWDLFTPKHGDFGPFFFPKKILWHLHRAPLFWLQSDQIFPQKKKRKEKKTDHNHWKTT